jgi:hypothetical protein
MQAFTADFPRIAPALLSEVGVSLPHQQLPVNTSRLWGLWDTGATGCAIKDSVAKAIGAQPISKVIVHGVHGPQPCNQYLVNFYLPNRIRMESIPATELFDNAKFDTLIGMDIISLGDFSTSTIGGKTSFTFRIPSCQKQDFARFWPKDNSVCVCGSGYMFKNCCRKLIGKAPAYTQKNASY